MQIGIPCFIGDIIYSKGNLDYNLPKFEIPDIFQQYWVPIQSMSLFLNTDFPPNNPGSICIEMYSKSR